MQFSSTRWSSKQRARARRRSPSPAENVLWRQLAGRKMLFDFRRQHVVNGEPVSFFCIALRLAVVVRSARQRSEHLSGRDAALGAAGITVLVVRAEDILRGVAVTKRLIAGEIRRLANEKRCLPTVKNRCFGMTGSGLYCQSDATCAKGHGYWLFDA